MSLRIKLALALVLLTSAATLAIGTWSYVGTSDRLYVEIDRSLADGTGPIDRNGPDPDHDNRPAPGAGQEAVLWQSIDTDGTVVIPSTGVAVPVEDIDRYIAADPRPAGTPASVRRDVTIDGQPYRILTTSQGNGRGAVQTARSLAETQRVLDSLRNFIIEAAVLVIVSAALAGWLIATQVTWRIMRLTATAEQVADTGRLDVEVPVKGRDEAGRLGTAFNEMLTALRGSRDSQQRLVQDAGHELRTPLTSLRTNVSVLRRHHDLPEETRARVLDDLDLEARELTDLVNELVDLATDRRADEPPETLDLVALVERVSERARRRSGRSIEVTVELDRDSALSTVTGWTPALERAVSNLLDNAAKFDTTDHPIEVTVELTQHEARVRVADRGPGIPPDDLPHVFDRFYRAVDARSRPGSGLGLAIVADVASQHGGHPTVANREGGGACVGFEFPVGGAAQVAGDEVLIGGVALDVGGDERALGHDLQVTRPGVVERSRGQRAADALALEAVVDLGVGEDAATRLVPVDGRSRPLVVDEDLVAVVIGVVGDADRGSHGPTLSARGVGSTGQSGADENTFQCGGDDEMGRLQDRVAIITGAGDGIGHGIARAFAREGARVLVAELNESAGAAVAAELTDEFGTEAEAVPTDVSDKAAVGAMVAAAVDRWGTVDVLVNNAWGGGSLGRLEFKTDEQLAHGFDVGFYGPLWAMQAAFPAMRAQGRGNIINLCSLNGVNAHIGTTEYNCAKEALRTLTRTAAREWAPHGIVANAICPGAKTAASRAVFAANPELELMADAANPMGRLGDPEADIAPVAVFLASDDAHYLTGNTLFVDGGSHINGAPWAPDLPDHP